MLNLEKISEQDIKCLHKEFFGMYSYPQFKTIINTATANRGALVRDVYEQNGPGVYYYKASKIYSQYKY